MEFLENVSINLFLTKNLFLDSECEYLVIRLTSTRILDE